MTTKMTTKIIKDKDFLHKKTQPVVSVEEGNAIAKKLIDTLTTLNVGIGLSANQIGISKSVSVVWINRDEDPLVLMNPEIISTSTERIGYMEGCLSLPGKTTPTVRFQTVKVKTLNHVNELDFGPTTTPITPDTIREDRGLLQCVCVQHEVDHLNGKLIIDPGVKITIPPARSIKYGRNDKVMIERNGETQFIKYKHSDKYVSEGWRII